MKSTEQIEEAIRKLRVEADNEERERVLRDLVDVHKQYNEKTPTSGRWHLGGIVMRHRPVRIAAVAAFAVLLVSGFSLSSHAENVVNFTLARLKEMVKEMRTKRQIEPPAMLPTSQNDAGEQTMDANRRAIMGEARFYAVSPNDEDVWKTLREQGIELTQGATNPETYYVVLSSEQATRFEVSLTLTALMAPRIIVAEGEQAMIGTDVLALAWEPTISGDGRHIESTLSFHDGERGFELSRLSVENYGVLLLRVKGIVFSSQENNAAQETLVLIRLSIE